jgi:hypothetical protein
MKDNDTPDVEVYQTETPILLHSLQWPPIFQPSSSVAL